MGWFFSSSECPVDEKMRAWIEYRMSWLANEFGLETWWSSEAVVPADKYFPDRYDGSENSILQMFARTCAYMGVDPDEVSIRLYTESQNADLGAGVAIAGDVGGTAGLYTHDGKHVVMIEASGMSNPVGIVGTMAHELSHVRLLGEGRVTGDEDDHEQLTDLATVFFGLGVFSANSVLLYEQWSKDGWSGWRTGKKGYLNERDFAYALALWAYVRRDKAWISHVRPNVCKLVKQGLRYLEKQQPKWFTHRRKKIES
jgi:hypothetical protein